MNYLGEYNINQRFNAFRNITSFKRNLLYKKVDDEEEIALRKLQFNQQNKEALIDENGYRTVNPEDLVINTSIVPVHNDKYVNAQLYTMEREAVEQENIQNTETKPFYLKIDPRDKSKLNNELNNLINGYNKIFTSRTQKEITEYIVDFVKSFNQFSMLYQSFHDSIKQDTIFKTEFETKLINLESIIFKMINFIKVIFTPSYADSLKGKEKEAYDKISKNPSLRVRFEEQLIANEAKKADAKKGAVKTDAEYEEYGKNRFKELYPNLPQYDKDVYSNLSNIDKDTKTYLSKTYSVDYLIQLLKDCLKILKEMIDGKGIHAYITTKSSDLFERNIERGVVNVEPNFETDTTQQQREQESDIYQQRMKDAEILNLESEKYKKFKEDQRKEQERRYDELMKPVQDAVIEYEAKMKQIKDIVNTNISTQDYHALRVNYEECLRLNEEITKLVDENPQFRTIRRFMISDDFLILIAFCYYYLNYCSFLRENINMGIENLEAYRKDSSDASNKLRIKQSYEDITEPLNNFSSFGHSVDIVKSTDRTINEYVQNIKDAENLLVDIEYALRDEKRGDEKRGDEERGDEERGDEERGERERKDREERDDNPLQTAYDNLDASYTADINKTTPIIKRIRELNAQIIKFEAKLKKKDTSDEEKKDIERQIETFQDEIFTRNGEIIAIESDKLEKALRMIDLAGDLEIPMPFGKGMLRDLATKISIYNSAFEYIKSTRDIETTFPTLTETEINNQIESMQSAVGKLRTNLFDARLGITNEGELTEALKKYTDLLRHAEETERKILEEKGKKRGEGKPIKTNTNDFERWKNEYIKPIDDNLKYLIENKKRGKIANSVKFLQSVLNMINFFLSKKLSVHSLNNNLTGHGQKIYIGSKYYLKFVSDNLKDVSTYNSSSIKLLHLKKLLLSLVAQHDNLTNDEIKMITKYARKL
jgi:hypothetical protein